MAASYQSPWDSLSVNEASFSQAILEELADHPWAANLIANINNNGGLVRGNKGLLFELRFAYSLQFNGIEPSYEIPGEGNSTLDFGFMSADQDWAVELMRLEETAAVRNATHTAVDPDGIERSTLHLSTNAEDPRQSSEGETIKAVQRICQKCEQDGRPYKFPIPDGTYHAILVDFRTFLDGPDTHDFIHVALGGEYVQDERCRFYWEGQLISGVFSPRTNLRGAEQARERVHFIGFINESAYEAGEYASVTHFVVNPNLFDDADTARAAIATWPLQPAILL